MVDKMPVKDICEAGIQKMGRISANRHCAIKRETNGDASAVAADR